MDTGVSDDTIIRRFTADEAIRMVERGIVAADERLELLDGVLVEMSPQGPRHAGLATVLAERLRLAYAERGHVREEKPLAAGPYDLPEPDVTVVRDRSDAFLDRHPEGHDVLLVAEISSSSQRIDRRKAAIYARAGVQAYWLVDVPARRLEVRSLPREGSYADVRILSEDDEVSLPESNKRWLVRSLFP
ncbi:MAG TPA: Uma2 family endonuclease [Polyangia bacterium]|nr:Uma2 family endonuclease [Polyangia bacterium]